MPDEKFEKWKQSQVWMMEVQGNFDLTEAFHLCWTAALASQREIGPCGKHSLVCYAIPDEKWKQREHLHYVKDKRTILFCTACAESAAAYAKGATDMREELQTQKERLLNILDRQVDITASVAEQPRDLSRLWELVERWNNEKNTHIHYCADELAAILKELEGK